MKTTILAILISLLSSLSPVHGGDYALLVGVKNYGQRSGFNALQFTENDIEALAKVLIENGYSPRNVTVMTQTRGLKEPALNPTDENIFHELDLILANRDASDSVVIAFAGHGVKFKDATTSYFAPIDVDLGTRKHLVSFDKVYQQLRKCPAQRKLLLSDACRNDPLSASARSAKSVTKPENEIPPGSTVALFSCEAGQVAREDTDLKHGVFFHFVLEGLRGKADTRDGDANGNGNGTVELTELASYTQKKVPDYVRAKFRSKQTPDLKTNASNLQQLLRYPLLRLSEKTITNSIGMKFALIPAGEFMMGSAQTPEEVVADAFGSDAEDVKYFKREHPQHRVRITKPFYLGMHEVTVGQFRQFVNEQNYKTEAERGTGGYGYLNGKRDFHKELSWKKPGMEDESFRQPDNHPVLQVSWNDANEFCRWLSTKDGVTYRLPTEAEWEFACRAGTTTPFHFGSILNGKQANCDGNYPYDTTSKGPYLKRTTPVGSFAANSFGLYDMHGNAFEWCADWFDEDYYKNSPVDDPRGPSTGSYRVFRGGGWFSYARFCRSAFRLGYAPGDRFYGLGFRVLRSSVK